MRRTPTKIIDKRAENRQGKCYGFAFLFGLISWALFDNGKVGAGFLFAFFSFILYWIASKIKTVFHKTYEQATYVKR
ncbi:MAG: hypothetical protein GQ532_14290 [Methylomarinum sp.]|nr:hypothetical protein [Methylomarinum sp.]